MSINLDLIKQLRNITGVGISDCKKALEESNGDLKEAISVLKKNGFAKSLSRNSREVYEGWIGSYIHHNGRLASLFLQIKYFLD